MKTLSFLAKAWMVSLLLGAPVRDERMLVFSMDVLEQGKTVATPKFVGLSGKTIWAERRAPNAEQADYQLKLSPTLRADNSIDIELDFIRHAQRSRFVVKVEPSEETRLVAPNGAWEIRLRGISVDPKKVRSSQAREPASVMFCPGDLCA